MNLDTLTPAAQVQFAWRCAESAYAALRNAARSTEALYPREWTTLTALYTTLAEIAAGGPIPATLTEQAQTVKRVRGRIAGAAEQNTDHSTFYHARAVAYTADVLLAAANCLFDQQLIIPYARNAWGGYFDVLDALARLRGYTDAARWVTELEAAA